MSRVTSNEQIKLKAAFYNNIAVGAAITGLVVPYVSLYSSGLMNLTAVDNPLFFIKGETVAGMICAWAISFFFRSRANVWIGTLEDDDD